MTAGFRAPLIRFPLASGHIPPRWAWHFRMLRMLRTRLQRDPRAAARPPGPGTTDDPLPGRQEEFELEATFRRLIAEANALAEVCAALRRLHEGLYGYCDATGRPIPAARLRAFPWCRQAAAVRGPLLESSPGSRPLAAVDPRGISYRLSRD